MPKIKPYYWLAFSFFGFFCAYGVFMPYFPAWLKSQSYAAGTIGFIVASAYIFRFLGSIFFTRFIKEAHHLLVALRYLAWTSCAVMLFMSLFVQNIWLLCIGLWLFSTVSSAAIPLSDTLATTWQLQVKNLDYGRVRLIGSCAFIVGVSVFGYFLGIIGKQYVGWMMLGLLLTYASVQMLSPSLMPQHQASEQTDTPTSLKALLKNPITLRIIIVVGLIQGSHAAYYVYSVIYWTNLGIPLQTTSLLWGASVAAEVLFFFFSSRLCSAYSIRTLLYACVIFTTIRWAAFPFATTVEEILPIQLMHSVTFALSHYTIVRYISTQPPKTFANLQGLYNAFAGCASIALLSALAGWLYPISPQATFLTMAGFAALGLFFVPRHLPKMKITSIS